MLVIIFLRHGGFWIDELYTLHSIRLSWPDMVMERLSRGHFPGYFILVRLWYEMWPDAQFELALRSMSVLFYALAVASFFLLARRTLSAPAYLVAVALFACNEVALRQASEARMYTVVLLIAVWIARCWYELQQQDPPRRWTIAMILLSITGFAISATIGVLLTSMIAVELAWRKKNRSLLKTLLLSLVLGLCVFIPGAFIHLQTADRVGIAATKPLAFLGTIVTLMPGVEIRSDYYRTGPLLVTLFVIGTGILCFAGWLIWKHRARLNTPLRKMTAVVILPLALITVAYPIIEWFDLGIMGPPRYFLTLMPLAALVGGWALVQTPRPLIVHGALTLFLLVSACAIVTVNMQSFRERITEYLAPLYQPGDGLIVTAHEARDGVELYLPGAKVDVPLDRWITDAETVRSKIEHLGNRDTVWLVWYRGNYSPVIDVARELWGDFECNRPDKPYGGLRVYRFSPPDQ